MLAKFANQSFGLGLAALLGALLLSLLERVLRCLHDDLRRRVESFCGTAVFLGSRDEHMNKGADDVVFLRATLLKGLGRGLDEDKTLFEGGGSLFHAFLVEQVVPEVNRILVSFASRSAGIR